MARGNRGGIIIGLVFIAFVVFFLRGSGPAGTSDDSFVAKQGILLHPDVNTRSDAAAVPPAPPLVWLQPSAVSFLQQNIATVKAFLASGKTNPPVTHVCVIGKVEKTASIMLELFAENALVVFFDETPVEGNHSGVFVTSSGGTDSTSSVQVLRYVGHPHFTLRRFMSDYPSKKCHLVVLDASAQPERIENAERLVAYLHSHTWHVSSGAPHLVIAASAWKEKLTGIRDWVIGCKDESNNGLLLDSAKYARHVQQLGRLVPAGVFLVCFQHTMPFFNPELAEVIEAASWEKVDLAPYNVVGSALQAEAKKIEYWLEGHSGEITLERKMYAAIASLPNIKTICEIGFNAGHSASLWLLANPTARVFMFDLFEHKYTRLNEAFLRSEGARLGVRDVDVRLVTINGSSIETVPKFAADHPDVKCDLLSVDGGHFGDIPLKDMKNMRLLANHDFHVLVIDDTNCDGIGCVDGHIASLVREGALKVLARVSEGLDLQPQQQFRRGVTVLQYTASFLAKHQH